MVERVSILIPGSLSLQWKDETGETRNVLIVSSSQLHWYVFVGHKRATDIMKRYLNSDDSPVQKRCTPLQHIQNTSPPSSAGRHQKSPRLLQHIQNTSPPSSAGRHQKSPGLLKFMCAKDNNPRAAIKCLLCSPQKDSAALNGTTTPQPDTSRPRTCTCTSKATTPPPHKLSTSHTLYDSEQHSQLEGQSQSVSPLSKHPVQTPTHNTNSALITPEREQVTAILAPGAKKRRLCLEELEVDKSSPRQQKEPEKKGRKRRRKSLLQKENQGSNCNARKGVRKANSVGCRKSDTKEVCSYV